VRLVRDVGNVIMDIDDVERIEVRAVGGKDTVTINDLTGTDVTVVTVDLAATSGGAAPDTTLDNVNVNGTAGDDLVLVASTGGKIAVTGLQAEVTVTHADKTDALAIIGGAGNDVIDATGLAIGKIDLHISGGIGNDIMIGSAGNDTVNGDQGDDIALLGAGNDVFVWNPGNGSDTVEGQAGTDTLRFIASGANEVIDVSANGGRARFFRNVGNITTDLNDVERIEFAGLGGADTIVVNDLSGTDVKLVAIDLAAIGGAGDGAADAVIVNGTGGNDKINVALAAGVVSVAGLAAPVTIGGAEFANDSLVINGLGGNDTINASKLPTGILRLTLDGGVGNDTITGNSDSNILLGGDGNDTIAGGAGDDVAFLGVGNDVFVWNPGDGSDVIEGQADTDTLRFTGANADEFIDIAANGGRVRLNRDIGNVALDIDDVERLEVRALGGADTVTVNDLTGTDVTQVLVDLAAVAGGKVPDAKIDKVNVNGTNGDDVITLATVAGEIVVTGLSAQVVIDHAGKTDLLTINGFGGDDVINASSFAANQIALQILGGLGADIVLGSAGNDTVNGGDGDDTALLGAGNDRFIWNPGDDNDTIEGQSGTDTLEFHGANIAENIDIAANGGRVLFFRDVANVVMDMNDVERIEFAALGGSDNIFLHDLAGTDLKAVAVDLGKAGGGGDGQFDSIIDDATTGNDIINVALSGGAVSVTGLAAQLTIANAEIANDILTINGLGGDDKISAAALPAATLQLTLNGGSGNDTITGNAGNNLLTGGADNDTLNGGAGNDTLHGEDGKDSLNGGAGNDTITGGAGDDTITVSSGNDTVQYTSVLDGHDLLVGFDGNAAGGQDTLDLDALFDSLFVAQVDRAARISITDNGASVEIAVDTDGNASFDLAVATLKTSDVITVGQDLLLGS
jgi:Ca2+-binding RTX toxin-like protein